MSLGPQALLLKPQALVLRLQALAVVVLLTSASLLAGCGGADSRPAKWSYIAPAIIEPNCATVSCHSAVAQRAGVILDTQKGSYDLLTSRGFVVRCQADEQDCRDRAAGESELMVLLRGQGSQRMPPDFALPAPDINLIAAWIANGAENN